MRDPIPLTDAAKSARTQPAGWISRTLALQTLTPMYGGGVLCRQLGPRHEPIRAPSIRGQLRFWWRARHASSFANAGALFDAERALWGGTGRRPNEVSAARVRLSLALETPSAQDSTPINMQHPDGYVLWPAAMPAHLSRWREGIRFKLTVRCPFGDEPIVKQALRDWVLFGGVGGRTRRGCGAVGLTEASDRQWLGLPSTSNQLDGFSGGEGGTAATAAHIVTLAGAVAVLGSTAPATSAMPVWRTAHGWLREFRQGAATFVDNAVSGNFARERPVYEGGGGGASNRPGRSRWPEPDKIRRAFATPAPGWAHPPRPGIGAAPAWPRASFGLPIQVKFQGNPRPGRAYPGPEPYGKHSLAWRIGDQGQIIERLPSPLIVKPMQLADGRVAPLALWLQRTLPHGAAVGLVNGATLQAVAPFDRLRGAGEPDYFTPLAGKTTTREAFLDWLATRPGVLGRYTL